MTFIVAVLKFAIDRPLNKYNIFTWAYHKKLSKKKLFILKNKKIIWIYKNTLSSIFVTCDRFKDKLHTYQEWIQFLPL